MQRDSFLKQYESSSVWLLSAVTGCVPILNPCRDAARVSISAPRCSGQLPFSSVACCYCFLLSHFFFTLSLKCSSVITATSERQVIIAVWLLTQDFKTSCLAKHVIATPVWDAALALPAAWFLHQQNTLLKNENLLKVNILGPSRKVCFFTGADLEKCSIIFLAQWIIYSEWMPS